MRIKAQYKGPSDAFFIIYSESSDDGADVFFFDFARPLVLAARGRFVIVHIIVSRYMLLSSRIAKGT